MFIPPCRRWQEDGRPQLPSPAPLASPRQAPRGVRHHGHVPTVANDRTGGGVAPPTTASSPLQEGAVEQTGGFLHHRPFPTAVVQGGAVVRQT